MKFKFKESQIAHRMLDGLRGIEIGGSAHNPFGLQTLNVGRQTEGTVYADEERRICGEVLKVDVVAEMDKLPFADGVWDFVVASHVIEHAYDPVGVLWEWLRVVKLGGLVFLIVPHKERMFDAGRPNTTIAEWTERRGKPQPKEDQHYSVWTPDTFGQMCIHFALPVYWLNHVDDKVGNGFIAVLKRNKVLRVAPESEPFI